MSTFIQELKDLKAFVKTALAGKTPKQLALKTKKIALDLTTTEGYDVIVDTEEDMPKVGDKVVTTDGSPVDDGKYEFTEGVLVCVGGVITEILPPTKMPDEGMAAELAELKTKYDALVAERTAEQAEIATLKTDVEAMAKLTSTYVPKAQKVAFKKQGDEPVKQKSIKELRAEKAAAKK